MITSAKQTLWKLSRIYANFSLLPMPFFMYWLHVIKHARQSVYFYVNNLLVGSMKDGFWIQFNDQMK